VYEFVRDCVRYDVRTVIISHGKGERSEPKALLKSHVNRWLRHLDEVMAFYTALPRHGGYGAVYVMLRKSPEKKLENKERHERRR
jgi:DNA-nicking Smr family endonuclease